jgi:hypothetical protein
VRKFLWFILLPIGCCYGQQDMVLPAATLASGSTLYQAPNSITNSSNFVVQAAASVTFKAGSYIRLEPGFHATAGTATVTFHAIIDPSAQSASGGITSQPPSAASPSKEYVYFGGRVVAIENPH